MWEKAVDYLNDKYNPNPPMTLIPSGQALATLYDSIQSGAFPGATTIDQFFDDRIHGNDTVRYLVACVNYAAVTGRSPVGLTNEPKKLVGRIFWLYFTIDGSQAAEHCLEYRLLISAQ